MEQFLYFPIMASKLLEEKFNTTYDAVYNEYKALPGAVISGSNCDNTPFCPNFFDRTGSLNATFTHPLLGDCTVFHSEDPLSLTMPQNSELTVLFDMLWGTYYSSYYDPNNPVRYSV